MATAGSTSDISERSRILECPICLEPFKKPKRLPCLHSFCLECLTTYVESTVTDEASVFNCPVCRKEVSPSKADAPKSEWAESLKDDELIISLNECADSDKSSTLQCGSCNREGTNTAAVIWCKQCREAFCESCNKCHKVFKQMVSHEFIPVQDLKENPLNMCSNQDVCPDHTDKLLQVYCVGHRMMCCITCLSMHHRKCEDIQPLEKMALKMEENNDIKKLFDQIDKLNDELEYWITKKDENRREIENTYEEYRRRGAEKVQQIKQTIETAEINFNNYLDESLHEQIQKTDSKAKKIKKLKKATENCDLMLKAVTTYGSAVQKFIASETIQTQLLSHTKDVCLSLVDDGDVNSRLGIEKRLDVFIVKVKTVGKVTVTTQPENHVISRIENTLGRCVSVNYLKATPVLKKSLKCGKCFNTNITGVGFISSGVLLANYGGSVVKELDMEGRVTGEYSGSCYDIASNGQSSVKYVLSTDDCIKVYSFLPSLTRWPNILQKGKISQKCGIDCNGKVIAMNTEGSISIARYDGTIVYTWKKKYRIPDGYIALCQISDHVCYCDGDAVVFASISGSIMHEIQIPSPAGIAFDGDANIYVCDPTNGCVRQFSADGQFSRELLKRGKSYMYGRKPQAIAFHPDNKKFLVAFHELEYVEIYNF